MQNYSFRFTPTESSAEATLLCIANHLTYKPSSALSLNKANQVESAFIEIINSKKSNIIVGCLYKYPNMDVSDFTKNYLDTLLDKLSKENKQVFLLGRFNINLLNYNDHQPSNEFLDPLASNFFIPYISQPTKLLDTQNPSLIIFSFYKNWSDVLKLYVNLYIEPFLDNMNSVLDEHAPVKQINKYRLKFKSKPWLTLAIQNSIIIKNNLLKRFINAKDLGSKGTFHRQ